ncbi:MAG: hypothetical protein ABEJ30_05580 [Halorientalis sp.]
MPVEDALDVVEGTVTAATRGPLEAIANAAVPLEGARIRVPSVTGPVRVELATVREAYDLIRHQQASLRRLDEALTTGGYTAEIYVEERQVATLGVGAAPGRTSRWLGGGRTEIHLREVLRATVRSP